MAYAAHPSPTGFHGSCWAAAFMMALTAGGLPLVGWVQAATYRQAGVRPPWSTPSVDALPATRVPAVTAATLAGADAERPPESEPPDVAAGQSVGAPARPTAAPMLGPPRRLRIPSIGVDSAVVDLGIGERGDWELPNPARAAMSSI